MSRRQRCCLKLDDTNTDCEKEKREPLECRELFAEKGDRKGRRCEDFHLVGDLEGGDGEIGDGDKLERVLDDVEESWYGKLPGICAEYFRAKMAECRKPGEG